MKQKLTAMELDSTGPGIAKVNGPGHMNPISAEGFTRVSHPHSIWSEIPSSELAGWCLRLAEEESASIRQFPLFNERFRRKSMKPFYLRYANNRGKVTGFACVISFGFPFLRCGAVIDGPIALDPWDDSGEEVRQLVSWLRSSGFIFVRCSHRDQTMIDSLAKVSEAVVANPLPFIPRYGGDLAVDLGGDDTKLLAGFQQIARQEIRRAAEAGCVIKKSADLNEFRKLWPVYAARARKKHVRLGSFQDYESMFKLSPRSDIVRIYNAYYGEKLAYSSVFLREQSMVHHTLGALDTEALGGNPTPSCLLHWYAMRDYRDLGCRWYNLGGPSGPVYAFKRKFRPSQVGSPTSVTLVLRPLLYRVWSRSILPVLKRSPALNRPQG